MMSRSSFAAPWSALQRATQRHPDARTPFCIDAQVVGSVARRHLDALATFPQLLEITDRAVSLLAAAPQRDAALDRVNRALRDRGLIRGWRNETVALPDAGGHTRLASIERAAARFWGTLTYGAHANGFVADATGRPTHLWIARRAFDKATDPGLFDNMVGGGVPLSQTPLQTLQREAWEEAGLRAGDWVALTPGGVLCVHRDVAEGLQHEWLFGFDIELRDDQTPLNQDGEVAAFVKLAVADALALAAGESMTVDAALVTLDFALRRKLLGAAQHAELHARHAALRAPVPMP